MEKWKYVKIETRKNGYKGNGNLKKWKCGNLDICKNGNLRKWNFGKMEISKNDNLEKMKI